MVGLGEKRNYMDVEDLDVYKKLCCLHIDVCELTKKWPGEEKFELGSQVRRSSNSAPAQLAEKNDDRHVRKKIEGTNRAGGEAAETVHHLFIAKLKGYITEKVYLEFRDRYRECIRMLNGLEKTLERKIPERDRRWQITEETAMFNANDGLSHKGWPNIAEQVHIEDRVAEGTSFLLTPETCRRSRRRGHLKPFMY